MTPKIGCVQHDCDKCKAMAAELEAAAGAAPVQQPAEPLTDDVVRALWMQTLEATKGPLPIEEFARAIEAAHGIRAKEKP